MSNPRLSVALLKEWIEKSPHGECFKKASNLNSALVEVSGAGRTAWVTEWLKKNPEQPIAWVERELSLLPTAFAQKGAGLERVLFIETQDTAWTLSTLLRSQLFRAIVTPWGGGVKSSTSDEKTLRRWQLLGEKSRCQIFLLSEVSCAHWSIGQKVETS